MENNWKEVADKLIKRNNGLNFDYKDVILEAMNLVFEATKKECANKAEVKDNNTTCEIFQVDKESILNINKPNLVYKENTLDKIKINYNLNEAIEFQKYLDKWYPISHLYEAENKTLEQLYKEFKNGNI